ncbi:amidohydrolase family protein [Alteraurantiacibacter aquimixticola]|uniref:Amidohydrolase n=1 Tax=Alteraurantiacibacter aquimixticola TaxID=2489173 RepID=A0A4T3F2R5_9SPHN|nr:amidohydrolase family protein [Alteraurantiacibacter aquimixticola]TIX51428.1 amidohydrolase [Alteraurantiacibacter aquimixticola]
MPSTAEGETAAAGPRVDCHAHVFDTRMPASPDAWTVPEYAFTPEDLSRHMDRHGIEHAVLSGLSISGGYNDYMIRALRQDRRLRGTAIVDPPADLYTLERMREDGIVGIRLQLARCESLPDLDSFDYRVLWRRVRDLGWHVQLAIEGTSLPEVLPALQAAEVDIVIDHFGHPDPADPLGCAGFQAMLAAVDTGRCWVKLSGGFRLAGTTAWRDDPDGDLDGIASQVASTLLEKVGTERLLWGSDAPFVGYEDRVSYDKVVADYRKWVPDPAMRAEICATGMRFYFS